MSLLSLIVSMQFLFNLSVNNNENSLKNDGCTTAYDTLSNETVYVYVDQMPEYPGGNQALMKYFLESFRYPEQEYFQASFIVEFVIDADGKLIAPRIKGKAESDLTEAEKGVIKVLMNAPKWKSGTCNGKNVPVKMFLPLKF